MGDLYPEVFTVGCLFPERAACSTFILVTAFIGNENTKLKDRRFLSRGVNG